MLVPRKSYLDGGPSYAPKRLHIRPDAMDNVTIIADYSAFFVVVPMRMTVGFGAVSGGVVVPCGACVGGGTLVAVL